MRRPHAVHHPDQRSRRARSTRADEAGAVRCRRPRQQPRRERRRAMNIVAIETATETVGVAVRPRAGAEAVFTLSGRRRHVETLRPGARAPAGPGGADPGGLDVVAVDSARPLHRTAGRRRRGQGTGPVAGHRRRRGYQPRHPHRRGGRGRTARPGAGLRRRPPGGGLRRGARAECGRGWSWRSPCRRACSGRPTWWSRSSALGGGPVLAGATAPSVTAASSSRDRCRGGPACPSRPPPRCWPWAGAPRGGRIARRAGGRRSPLHA